MAPVCIPYATCLYLLKALPALKNVVSEVLDVPADKYQPYEVKRSSFLARW